MGATKAKVRIDTRKLRKFRQALKADLSQRGRGPIGQVLGQQWPRTYLDFTRERYAKLSPGGGEWKDLAAETLRRRRKRGNYSDAILYDRGYLYGATFPGRTGSLIARLVRGVRVGIEGALGRIAEIQHFGAVVPRDNGGTSVIPPRTILVFPNDATRQKLRQQFAVGMRRLISSL